MNFGFNDEQELLRSTARKFFENECGSDTVRRLMETPEGISSDLWTKIAEQGWLGLVFPEAYDGLGLGLVDLVVLMEEMGRAVVPGPYFSTVLLGGLSVLEAGSEAQKKEWLPKIAAGDKRVALAWMEPSAQLGPAGVTLTAVEKGGRYTLSGTNSSCTTGTPPTRWWWRRAPGRARARRASRCSCCPGRRVGSG